MAGQHHGFGDDVTGFIGRIEHGQDRSELVHRMILSTGVETGCCSWNYPAGMRALA